MNTVTLGVSSRDAVKGRFVRAMQGEKQGNLITFETIELLLKVLTLKRWDILRALTGAGPVSIREAARRVSRDVKAVHGDITALLNAGILQKEGNKIVFPYDQVHVDFTFEAAEKKKSA